VADLTTPRLRLVPATPSLVDAELAGPERLAAALGVALPTDWPPEHHDAQVLRFTRDALATPGAEAWWMHWFCWTGPPEPTVVGTGGYVGPPEDGTVEIGYSVVPSWQRRGIATEASRALVDAAWERGARRVIAHTLPHLAPSIGVLERLGFARDGEPEPGVLRFALERPQT
jgi:RimJ/RimL family protein N-acetyltransferase